MHQAEWFLGFPDGAGQFIFVYLWKYLILTFPVAQGSFQLHI